MPNKNCAKYNEAVNTVKFQHTWDFPVGSFQKKKPIPRQVNLNGDESLV